MNCQVVVKSATGKIQNEILRIWVSIDIEKKKISQQEIEYQFIKFSKHLVSSQKYKTKIIVILKRRFYSTFLPYKPQILQLIDIDAS